MNYPQVSRAELYHVLLTGGVRSAMERYGVSHAVLTALRIMHRIPGWVVHPLQRRIMQVLKKHGPLRLGELVAKLQDPRTFRQSVHATCRRMIQLGYLEQFQIHGTTVYQVKETAGAPVPQEDATHA